MEENQSEELKIMPRGTAPRSLRKGRNMIAVASGKGGVGKTWFSVTLAHALSGLRQKTLLFDGDLGLANIDIQLGLMVKDDLGSVIAGAKTLNQVIHHCDKTHFDIIAGRSGSAGLASMPVGRLQILGEDLSLLASNYNKVILDMGAGVEKPVRILSGMAEKTEPFQVHIIFSDFENCSDTCVTFPPCILYLQDNMGIKILILTVRRTIFLLSAQIA